MVKKINFNADLDEDKSDEDMNDDNIDAISFGHRKYVTYKKLLSGEYPAEYIGTLTAKPSGMFCIPIPIARFLNKSLFYVLFYGS